MRLYPAIVVLPTKGVAMPCKRSGCIWCTPIGKPKREGIEEAPMTVPEEWPTIAPEEAPVESPVHVPA